MIEWETYPDFQVRFDSTCPDVFPEDWVTDFPHEAWEVE
jgi:hypothetical protein